MSTPEALRLADVLEKFYFGLGRIDATSAADELRRQHAELERLTADHSALLDTCRLQTAEVRGLSEQVAELTAERDALREALRGLDEAYCRANTQLSKAERNEDRLRLVAARAALAQGKEPSNA